MANLNNIGGIHYEIMKRCYNPKSVMWKTYGALGITVCEEWHNRDNFRKWCKDNGYVKGKRVDRIDSTKGYFPENCFLGNKNTMKNGYNMMIKKRAKENREIKNMIGLRKYYDSPVFGVYNGMKKRCYKSKTDNFMNYGGRGIKICDEWLGKYGFNNFHLWSMENGYRKGLSIDRIDVNGNYSPDNCKWSTVLEQANNKRNTIYVKWNDEIITLSNFSRKYNMKYGMLYGRIRKGMSIEEAVNDIIYN